MLSHFLTYLVAALILSLEAVQAGPGANVFGCISIQHDLPALHLPSEVFFYTNENAHCMNHKGQNALFNVTKPGLTCTDLGYVEAKKSGLCALGASIWDVGFDTPNGTQAVVMTKWSSETREVVRGKGKENIMNIKQASKNVLACPREELCVSEKVEGWPGIGWPAGTRGPIYIIFKL